MLRFLFIMVITGCIFTPCKDDTFTIDAIEPLCFDNECVDRSSYVYIEVERLKSEGWSCPSENLYNAFGRSFGTRFNCSICK